MVMKILVLDNYDSFTYNLVQMTEQIVGHPIFVAKNNEIGLKEIEEFDKIILSPGPGVPSEAGNLLDVIQEFHHKKPILGVCLGMQAIAEVFGGSLINLKQPFHGVATKAIRIKECRLLKNLPDSFDVGRYHSWAVTTENFPDELEITSLDPAGRIMSLQHKKYPVHGVQFHPESILTPFGKTILSNFLK